MLAIKPVKETPRAKHSISPTDLHRRVPGEPERASGTGRARKGVGYFGRARKGLIQNLISEFRFPNSRINLRTVWLQAFFSGKLLARSSVRFFLQECVLLGGWGWWVKFFDHFWRIFWEKKDFLVTKKICRVSRWGWSILKFLFFDFFWILIFGFLCGFVVSEDVPMAAWWCLNTCRWLSLGRQIRLKACLSNLVCIFVKFVHLVGIFRSNWNFYLKIQTKFECAEPLIESACPEALKTRFLDKIHMLTSENGRGHLWKGPKVTWI